VQRVPREAGRDVGARPETFADAVMAEGAALEGADARETESARPETGVGGGRAAPAAAPALPEAAAPKSMSAAASTMEPGREAPPAEKKALLTADTDAYVRLAHTEPGDAPAWREHREAWRGFVEAHPQSIHADEARVRTVEAGLAAWRLEGATEDLARARTDAESYLARPDAAQKGRVRRALANLPADR
jgi:hypothetical protein